VTIYDDYFEKRGVKFIKPKPLSALAFFFNKLSLPDIVKKWYNTSEHCNEK
jgi:hypothetical protein